MDDLEDLIMLNIVLKSEGANTSTVSCDGVAPLANVEGKKESNDPTTVKDVPMEVDYSEEIERDVKEAEQNIILQKVEHILNSGLEIPTCVTESLMALEKDDLVIVDKCSSAELRQLMLLNRTKRKHLVDVLKQILELLNTTNRIIWQKQKDDNPKSKWTAFKSGSSSLGTPFFKLRNNKVSCWSNVDVERKRHNNELMLCRMMPPIKWTLKDKLLLKKFVAVFYSCAREKELLGKIKKLENICETEEDPEKTRSYHNDIKKMRKEIHNLRNSKKEIYPELNSNDNIDWYEISEQMKGRHSASECKAHWNMFLHPDRKEDNWTKSEDSKLTELAKKYNYQNWEKIAEELGPSRSPFSACSQYYSKLCKRNYRREKFHPEEDELLLDIIETCKIGNYIPWSKVSYYFGGRTKNQLYHRYTYYLARKNKRKVVQFTFEEDALIMALVERLGKNFSKVAKYVPDRSSMQIKNRYNCYLQNPDLTYRPFSIDEDRQILEHAADNNSASWGVLAKLINLPRSHLRHRFNTLCNWLAKNPEKDLSEIPRRYVCRANELNAKFHHLKAITDALKNVEHIPTLEDVRKLMGRRKLKVQRPRTFIRNAIHQQLIDYFRTGYKVSRTFTFVTEGSTEKDAAVVDDILQILGADLELPSLHEIDDDPNLDRMDNFLLNHIIHKRQSSSVPRGRYILPSPQNIRWLLPPNIGTVVGLRNMIMTLSITKSKPVVRDDINYSDLLALNLESLSETTRMDVIAERKKFQQRLYSVFRWPSIMSLVDVGDIKLPCSEMVRNTVDTVKRKRGRPKKDSTQINLKIKKMLEGREKKRKERAAAAGLLSIKDFAKLNTCVNEVNIGASTSRDFKSFSNVSQNTQSYAVKKTDNLRTYKRKRIDIKTEVLSEPSEKIFVLEDEVKPIIKTNDELCPANSEAC